MTIYKPLAENEKNELLNKREERKYSYIGHSFSPLVGTGKSFCTSCGLIALRNKFSDWCIEKGCLYDAHPSFKSTKQKFGSGIQKLVDNKKEI